MDENFAILNRQLGHNQSLQDAFLAFSELTRYDDDPSGDLIQPAGKHFLGKVFVLIDSTNSSATFQFAQNIQSHHLGTLVGRPTGGSQNQWRSFFLPSPPSLRYRMDLPLIGTFAPIPMPDTGVTPDILVSPTAADIAAGLDPALAAVMRMAHR
jgi:C-terminal processing protease CtpA/Prc